MICNRCQTMTPPAFSGGQIALAIFLFFMFGIFGIIYVCAAKRKKCGACGMLCADSVRQYPPVSVQVTSKAY